MFFLTTDMSLLAFTILASLNTPCSTVGMAVARGQNKSQNVNFQDTIGPQHVSIHYVHAYTHTHTHTVELYLCK